MGTLAVGQMTSYRFGRVGQVTVDQEAEKRDGSWLRDFPFSHFYSFQIPIPQNCIAIFKMALFSPLNFSRHTQDMTQ